MTSLYILIKYLTFPGALVRGMWEQIVCRFCKVPVEDNRYLRRDEMISHIDHEFMPKAQGAFAICFVPFFFNMLGAVEYFTYTEFVYPGSYSDATKTFEPDIKSALEMFKKYHTAEENKN